MWFEKNTIEKKWKWLYHYKSWITFSANNRHWNKIENSFLMTLFIFSLEDCTLRSFIGIKFLLRWWEGELRKKKNQHAGTVDSEQCDSDNEIISELSRKDPPSLPDQGPLRKSCFYINTDVSLTSQSHYWYFYLRRTIGRLLQQGVDFANPPRKGSSFLARQTDFLPW